MTTTITPENIAVDGTAEPPKLGSILCLMDFYLPGYKAGGPIRAMANLIAALGDDFDFRMMTYDRDLGDSCPYPDIDNKSWIRVGKAVVLYVRPDIRGLYTVMKQLFMLESDTVLYINSFFSRRYSMLPVLLCRFGLCRPRCIVLSPRGEFSRGALGIHPLRKRLFLIASSSLSLYRNVIWGASSSFEAKDIRRQFDRKSQDRCEIVVASDLPDPSLPDLSRVRAKKPGELRVVLVGRVSRMKNVDTAIKLLVGIRGDIIFDIIGPIEDVDYWHECQSLIANLPDNITVNVPGQVKHEDIARVFAVHDLMLLPTYGENFGHVIYEALAMGCPVLISDRTPWRNLESAGVGWDIPLSEPARFRAVLQQCVDSDEEWISAHSKRAKQFAYMYSSVPTLVKDNYDLFHLAMHRTQR